MISNETYLKILLTVLAVFGAVISGCVMWIVSQIIHVRDDVAQVNGRLGTMEVKMETTYARVDAITAVEYRVDVLEARQDAP